MSWKKTWAGALMATALAVPPASAQFAESVAAIVNDAVISTYDVRQRANLLLISAGLQATPDLQQRARAQALRELVDERLQIQEAGEYNISITPAEIDTRIEAIARTNNSTRADFEQRLADDGVSISTLRLQVQADIGWQRLMGGLYGSRIRISEVEITETQSRIAASATQPRYLLSEIFLPAETEQEFTDMTNGGMRLLEEMQRGAPFPAVARQFSAAPSAAAGGDMGWMSQAELSPEVRAVVERLQPGQVSLPVRTPTGVHIVALRERQEGVAAGSTSRVSLRMITAPAASQAQLERAQSRVQGCGNLDRITADISGAEVIDLGEAAESDLSEAVRTRVADVQVGSASPVVAAGEQASMVVVCSRETGGAGVPTREEIENRLYDQELAMLSDRYLRNLRREATIITR